MFRRKFKIIQLSFLFSRQTSNVNSLSISGAENELLKIIWDRLVDEYFPDHQNLKNYSLLWSKRVQTRCLASCNIERRIVRVARSMKLTEARIYLEPLLYHELCHAVAGIRIVRGRRRVHTREFKILERRHPMIPMLDQWIKNGGWSKAVRRDARLKSVCLG
jgi:hypothetical protein